MQLQILLAMNLNAAACSAEGPSALNALRVRRAIAEAQTICAAQGQNSPACGLTWDHALALQVQPWEPQPGPCRPLAIPQKPE